MSVTTVAKLKFILPSLYRLSEKALSVELDKLSEGNDVITFYKNLNQSLDIRKKNILFLGAPGSGKGTYARIISPLLMIPTFGSGDYMKREMKIDSEFGKNVRPYVNSGALAPDDTVLPVLQSVLAQPVYKSGVILDGFPRNLVQALAVESSIPIDLVMYFHLPREVLIDKLMGRRVCPLCGRSYNIANIVNGDLCLPPLLPKESGLCDNCHVNLIQRSDDKREIIEHRLEVYEKQTSPLLDFYGANGNNILKRFDIKKGVADVPDIMKLLTIHFLGRS